MSRTSSAVQPPLPLVLDLAGAAAYTGLTERWLKDAAKAGLIPVVDLYVRGTGSRRTWRFRRVDLDALINGAVTTLTPVEPPATRPAAQPQVVVTARGTTGTGPLLSARDALRKSA